MAGVTTPVLSALGTVNRVAGAVSTVDRLTGISARRRSREAQREREREAAVLSDTQAVQRRSLEEEQRLETEIAERGRTLERARLTADEQEAERKRRAALRAAVSRTRAQLGGQGISATDGSGEAILLGLVREEAEDAEAANRRDALREAALEAEADAGRRRNLLEQTRLAERQRLERLARGFG